MRPNHALLTVAMGVATGFVGCTLEMYQETCTQNSDCQNPELVCRSGICEHGTRCQDRSDCQKENQEICINHTCTAVDDDHVCNAQNDDDCPVGRICHNGKCIEKQRCNENDDCADSESEVCIDHLCEHRSVGDSCKNQDDSDCPGSLICYAGKCSDSRRCSEDSPCHDDEFCTNDKICEKKHKEGEACTNDSECSAGTICFENACIVVRRCDDDSPCHDDEYCNDKAICTPKKGADDDCLTDEECRAGTICIAQKCARGVRCNLAQPHCADDKTIRICDDDKILVEERRCEGDYQCYSSLDPQIEPFCGPDCNPKMVGETLSLCSPNLRFKIRCTKSEQGGITTSYEPCGTDKKQGGCVNPNLDNTPMQSANVVCTSDAPATEMKCSIDGDVEILSIYKYGLPKAIDAIRSGSNSEKCIEPGAIVCEHKTFAITGPNIPSKYIEYDWEFKFCRPRFGGGISFYSYHMCPRRANSMIIDSLTKMLSDPQLERCSQTHQANQDCKEYNQYKSLIQYIKDHPRESLCCDEKTDFFVREIAYKVYNAEPCKRLILEKNNQPSPQERYYLDFVKSLFGIYDPPIITAIESDTESTVFVSDDQSFACYNGNTLLLRHKLFPESDTLMNFTQYAQSSTYNNKLKCDADLVPMYFIDQYVSQLKSTKRPVTCRISTKSSEIDAIDIEIDGEQKTVGFCPPNTRLQGCKDGEQVMLRSIKCSPN